jgi:trehalose 6-phosphate synthase
MPPEGAKHQEPQSDLLVVSNRGPLNFVQADDGSVAVKRAGGGLVVTLGPGVERDKALWLAAEPSPEATPAPAAGEQVDAGGFWVQPVNVDEADYRAYYDVVANQTLWFAVHGLWDLPRRPRFDQVWWSAWERFRSVNRRFAEVVAATARQNATVLIQDFHLALVPGILASVRPDLRTATFIHTPWCHPDELAVLPDLVAEEILSGMALGGSSGFHSPRWAAAFEGCCQEVLGRTPATFVSPAATDADDLRRVAASPECQREFDALDAEVGDRQLIVRVDRMELSKNVLRGFWAFDELLEQRPDLVGRVAFAAMVYPSRLGLAEYQAYGQEAQALVARLNAKWARPGWTPIVLDPDDNYPRSVAALRRSDVLLVNPVRDGLNLVAKEGPIVNERDGVLVLSRYAGAWDELGTDAVGVNPFDISGTAAALGVALDMSPSQRAQRAAALRKAAWSRSPLDWFDDQLSKAAVPAAVL